MLRRRQVIDVYLDVNTLLLIDVYGADSHGDTARYSFACTFPYEHQLINIH